MLVSNDHAWDYETFSAAVSSAENARPRALAGRRNRTREPREAELPPELEQQVYASGGRTIGICGSRSSFYRCSFVVIIIAIIAFSRRHFGKFAAETTQRPAFAMQGIASKFLITGGCASPFIDARPHHPRASTIPLPCVGARRFVAEQFNLAARANITCGYEA